jgi:hypothetical protein
MNSQTRPERLFRYFPPDASNFFAAKKLWFSAPSDFNDPFDALPRFDALMKSQREASIKRQFAFLPSEIGVDWQTFKKTMTECSSEFMEDGNQATAELFRSKFSQDFRMICFSENLDDLLMWGHYGKGHTGFMIQFNPVHRMFDDEEFAKVDYPDSDERGIIANHDQTTDELWKIPFKKSRQWDYEKEWRFVKLAISLTPGVRDDGEPKHFMELPADSVLAVYFGWQMPPKRREELLESLKLQDWKDVKKFIMRPDKARYAIKPVPWEEWLSQPKEYKKELVKLIPRLG